MSSDISGSEDEEIEQFYIEDNTQVLVAIDCCESMFEPLQQEDELTGIQLALRALHAVYDDLILTRIRKNKLAVAFFHPDPDKMILIDFDSPMLSLIKSLKELAYSPVEKLKTYKNDGLKFSRFLIECRKKFKSVNKKDNKYFLFVTNNGDPCRGDANEKFLALREFKDFKECGIYFKLTPLVEEFNYEAFFTEAYGCMDEPKPKHFYDLEYLTDFIRHRIRFKAFFTNIKLHLSMLQTDKGFIQCTARKPNQGGKLITNKTMTRDLQKEAYRTTERQFEEQKFNLVLSEQISDPLTISKSEKCALQKVDQIKMGLTVTHSSKKRYSELGFNLANPFLINSKKPDDSNFMHLWEACVKNELSLLGFLKYKQLGKVHSVELVPQMVNYQRQFLVNIIPHSIDLYESSVKNDEVIEYDGDILDIFNELVDEATISDYQVANVRPFVYNRKVKYFKKELLGNDYIEKDEYTDFADQKAFEGNIEPLIQKLENMFPDKKGTKRATSRATSAPKRGRR